MKRQLALLLAACLLPVEIPQAAAPVTNATPTQPDIPYVSTRHDAVKDMLWLAEAGKDDVVYDLGSGDGRVVIAAVRDFGARKAVGIEIDPRLIRESRENARKAGVANRVRFIEGDLFTNDFSEATVVVAYLGHEANLQLRPKMIRTLKPGTRVVSHQFGMGEWAPDKFLRTRTFYLGMIGYFENPFKHNPWVPGYEPQHGQAGRVDTLSLWLVPAPIAGVWRGKVPMKDGDRDLKLILHQQLSETSSAFELLGTTNVTGDTGTDVWGNHVRFECYPSQGVYNQGGMLFDGQVQGDTMKGTLTVFEDGRSRECQWEGRRDKPDFSGTWEWTGAVGARPVQLQIGRTNGQLSATYSDPGLAGQSRSETVMPVNDLYDFGGGFYFTVLIGRQKDGSITMNDSTGWLIGEGVSNGDTLNGTSAFYPYKSGFEKETDTPPRPTKWTPKRVTTSN